VSEVVCEARGIDQIGIETESLPDFAADLGHFERVGQAVARKVETTRRGQHLSLGGESP
jgi:hypothetical protein